MKLYFPHSREFDYKKEFYAPLQASKLAFEHELIFPHLNGEEGIDSKKIIKTCDIVFAEVSYPSTGLGIELGWADAAFHPVVCLYKKGAKISSSLKTVSKFFIEYDSAEDLVAKVGNFVSRISFE